LLTKPKTMKTVTINVNTGAMEAILLILPICGDPVSQALQDENGITTPFYTMMKRNPTLSARIIKTHFANFIVSTSFKNVKNREFFGMYMLLGKNIGQKKWFGLLADDEAIERTGRKLNHILALAQDGIYATWTCLPLLRNILVNIEFELIMGVTLNIGYGELSPICDLYRQTKKMYFNFAYSNVVKRCHNPTCGNISTNQCSCHQTRYCSSACQLADWKRHKTTCQFIKK